VGDGAPCRAIFFAGNEFCVHKIALKSRLGSHHYCGRKTCSAGRDKRMRRICLGDIEGKSLVA